MNTNLPNKIYKNILSEQDIKDIYIEVEKAQESQTMVLQQYRQKAYFIELPKHVIEKITNFVQNIYPEKLKLTEISFATYKKINGEDPMLSPHFDSTFEEPRFTFDLQLKSNILWPIVIEGRSYTLNNNEALVFSGTNQIHWRSNKKFKDDDFADMIFCHFSLEENSKKITLDETRELIKKLLYYKDEFYQNIIKGLNYDRTI